MANKFTKFLKQTFTGATNPKGNVGNYQHATRLYLDNSYRLMPRSKFLYYVRFELHKSALQSQAFTNKHADEIGYLIKTADFPKFNIDSTVKNQYNRKKIIYKQINYEPVNLTFHDDSAGIVNALWALYYGYYFADRSLPDAAWGDTLYMKTSDPRTNFRYGLDNNKKSFDFIKSISLYTLSRRRFNGYTLVNPRIKSWTHAAGDYGSSEFMDHQMSLEYEAVQYSSGQVKYGSPKGFASLYYDTTPSPLSVAGGGVANVFGAGGVLDGLESVFGNVGDGTAFGSVGGFLSTAISAANTFKNLGKVNIGREVIGILSSPAGILGAVNTVGGLIGAAVPKNSNSSDTTTASPRTMIADNGSVNTQSAVQTFSRGNSVSSIAEIQADNARQA
jgi:hypothetical protein